MVARIDTSSSQSFRQDSWLIRTPFSESPYSDIVVPCLWRQKVRLKEVSTPPTLHLQNWSLRYPSMRDRIPHLEATTRSKKSSASMTMLPECWVSWMVITPSHRICSVRLPCSFNVCVNMVTLLLASVDIGCSLLSSEVARRIGWCLYCNDDHIADIRQSPDHPWIFQVDAPNFQRYVVRSNVKGRPSVGKLNQLMLTDRDVQYCGISESSDLLRVLLVLRRPTGRRLSRCPRRTWTSSYDEGRGSSTCVMTE